MKPTPAAVPAKYSGVACLYVDPRGPYPKLVGPEMCWDEQRDARTYAGPWPVVAHPPCGPWGALSGQCTRQDKSLGPRGVEQVREFGGVLEHPAHSKLFRHCRMPFPGDGLDADGGRTVEVNQVSWGHPCEKRTWLYCVGVPYGAIAEGWKRGGKPTHTVTTSRGTKPGLPELTEHWRRAVTPVAFAEWLIALAQTARPT